jgi:hypothetical protein
MLSMAAESIGRDSQGDWVPGCMTHAELARELGTATGERRAELVREAHARMRLTTYPLFPVRLNVGKPG